MREQHRNLRERIIYHFKSSCGSHNFRYQIFEKFPRTGYDLSGGLGDFMTQIWLKREREWALQLQTHYPIQSK